MLARAAYSRRYNLDRLPKDDPKLLARATEILRELPDAQVRVGPKPTTAAEEATQVQRRARGETTEVSTLGR
ncbi:MAG: hypothetical protein ABI614_25855 [Planctomycetota bacterium]